LATGNTGAAAETTAATGLAEAETATATGLAGAATTIGFEEGADYAGAAGAITFLIGA